MKPGSFTAERLLALYERVSDADDAIPRLRRFVLDLAVRGKLVEQDPGDGSAGELLIRLAQEKSRLIKAGKIKKPRDLDDGAEVTPAFELPESWQWCRLDAVGAIIGGGTPSATDASNFAPPGEGFPWLTPADLGGFKDLFISRGARDLTEKGLASSSATPMPAGSVLFTSRAPIGYVAIAANPISTNQGFKSIVPYLTECSTFIALAMKNFAPEIDAEAPGTTFKEVSGKIVAAVPFPLPPLAEQQRIVAKVDELLALCDQLEAARVKREAARDRLTAATLARLTAPEADGEAFADHARFALETLPKITTRPDQIKTLRQTILNLAVRGKLVEQDPTDEPSAELLKQIGKQRTRLLENKKVREVRVHEKKAALWDYGPLPKSWALTTIAQVAHLRSGVALNHGEEHASGEIPYLKVADLSLVDNERGIVTSSRFVGERRRTDVIPAGSIVFPKRGGAIATNRKRVSKVDIVGDSNLMAMQPYLAECLPFIEMWFSSFDLWALNSGTSVPQINNKDIYPLSLPLPPLAEQHRIVAKVDTLMAVCDQLETSLISASAAQLRLLDALLNEAIFRTSEQVNAA